MQPFATRLCKLGRSGYRNDLALAEESQAEMKEGMKAAIEKGELPALKLRGMAYMLSKQGFLNSQCGNCAPHLMFYVPVKDANTWGAGALGTAAESTLEWCSRASDRVHRSCAQGVGRNVGEHG